MDFAGGAIQCFLGPDDLGGRDDLEGAIVASMDGATKTIDIAVQEIDSVPVAKALIRKRLTRKAREYKWTGTNAGDWRTTRARRSIAYWACASLGPRPSRRGEENAERPSHAL